MFLEMLSKRKLSEVPRCGSALFIIVCLCFSALIISQVDEDEEFVVHKSPFCNCSRAIRGRVSLDNSTIHWCSAESTLRGFGQNIFSLTLYGNAQQTDGELTRYYTVLHLIPREVKQYFPDWRIRIHHGIKENEAKERELVCKVYCENDNVDLCDVPKVISSLSAMRKKGNKSVPVLAKDLAKFNRMNWRYLPMIDPAVDRMMARDTDSQVNSREHAAVNEWLQSDYTFHIMRDHTGHYLPIMGGMFGVKVYKQRYLVQGLIRAMIQFGTREGYGLDQLLLAKLFWPIAKDDAVIQDSYYCEKAWNSLPPSAYPTQKDPVNKTFVTERIGAYPDKPGPCPVACRPPDHKDWEFC